MTPDLFEIQLCSYNNYNLNKKIIYSKHLLQKLPSEKIVLQNIKHALKPLYTDLKVQLVCPEKDVHITANSKTNYTPF